MAPERGVTTYSSREEQPLPCGDLRVQPDFGKPRPDGSCGCRMTTRPVRIFKLKFSSGTLRRTSCVSYFFVSKGNAFGA